MPQSESGEALPWLTYPAIDYLSNQLRPSHQVLEFGAGNSTLFFANRVKKLISIESNPRWYEIIQQRLPKISPAELMLAKIDDYPNAASNCAIKFDFILIDSIQRFSCAQSSISLLNPRGSIILDDSQRDNYKKIFDFFELNGFTKRDFWGIEPGGIKIKNTTFFNQGSPQGGAGAHAPLFNIN